MYRKKINTLIADIQTRPFLEITTCKINKPLARDTLKQLKQQARNTGYVIDPAILHFYSELNGFTFCWQYRSIRSFAASGLSDDVYDDYPPLFEDDQENPYACINILPLEDVMSNKHRFNPDHYDDTPKYNYLNETKTYSPKALAKRLKLFDVYSDFSAMAFLFTSLPNTNVTMLSDYYDDWFSSVITDFTTYMDILFITRGIVDAREAMFNQYEGYKQTLAINDKQALIPKLFL